jgi:U3 small nucleolar RNA-associated protein 4
MTTTISAHILVIDLGADENTPRVLRRFDHHRLRAGDRVIKGRKVDEDVEMDVAEHDQDMDTLPFANILRLAISADGQWLASSDDRSRTHIFNLDSVQVIYLLP